MAEDRGREVQTDLFFIEVQPFNRNFSQGQGGGGGGGGGGGQEQDEISRRQKEILVATWNLIKERSEETSSYLDEQQLHDNAQMLADLQRTLAEQARTLASRTRARGLTEEGPAGRGRATASWTTGKTREALPIRPGSPRSCLEDPATGARAGL